MENATRIDSACFTDDVFNRGLVDVEFWVLSGSIVRTTYTRRTTKTTYEFIPVASEVYTQLKRMAEATFFDI